MTVSLTNQLKKAGKVWRFNILVQLQILTSQPTSSSLLQILGFLISFSHWWPLHLLFNPFFLSEYPFTIVVQSIYSSKVKVRCWCGSIKSNSAFCSEFLIWLSRANITFITSPKSTRPGPPWCESVLKMNISWWWWWTMDNIS